MLWHGPHWRGSLKRVGRCLLGPRRTNGTTAYQPLKLLEIRLLELEPSADAASTIRCRLRKRSLLNLTPITGPSDPAAFEVLSYTWGDARSKKCIVVNDHAVSVTTNLESFLRIRRQPDVSVTLWIDALCINQNDAHEKNFQIPLMLLIYAAAWRLTVWLGPERDNSNLAMRTLVSLGGTSAYEKMPMLEPETKQALDALLTRPWWTRVWIVQELALGGAGIKLERIQVLCGERGIPWGSIVVAAARMRGYHDDLRQPFPNFANILELDSLRESAVRFLRLSPTSRGSFDLVCRYRHFRATDPRDKLYALAGLCSRVGPGPEQIMPRYEAPVEDIYTSFACNVLSAGQHSLELLRHAGPSAYGLPSWVPDWSTPLGCKPLPLTRMQRYFDVPWWAEPTEEKPHVFREDGTLEPSRVAYRHFPSIPNSQGPEDAAELRRASLKRLEIGAAGYGVVRSVAELPPNFLAHGVPREIKGRIEELLRTGDTMLCVSDQLRASEENASISARQVDAVKVGEILVERRVKQWLLRELQEDLAGAPYRAAGDSALHTKASPSAGTLELKGVICDTVSVCHEGFVEDVDTDWRNTTRFMVDVGQCKALAMAHDAATGRYPDLTQRLQAFWKTLLVGQTTGPDEFHTDETGRKLDCYEHWLPRIPSTWKPSTPATVPLTAGLVEMAESAEAIERAKQALKRQSDGRWVEHVDIVTPTYPEFNPEHWPEAERQQYKQDARAAAASWHQQPFDLYHRPFRFQNTIPDPYWETRQREDERARQCSRTGLPVTLHSGPPRTVKDRQVAATGAWNDSGVQERRMRQLLDMQHKVFCETPSMVPRCSLAAGMERYALGRSFFVTESGRFGLGPKGMRIGDKVAVVFGSGVPFVLRGPVGEEGSWRLVGECYVQDVMGGEVMEEMERGKVKEETILLR